MTARQVLAGRYGALQRRVPAGVLQGRLERERPLEARHALDHESLEG